MNLLMIDVPGESCINMKCNINSFFTAVDSLHLLHIQKAWQRPFP